MVLPQGLLNNEHHGLKSAWTRIALEGAAHGVGGVSIPEGAQEMAGFGPQCHSLVDKLEVSQRLDSMVSEVFFNLNYSVILCESVKLYGDEIEMAWFYILSHS